MATLFLYLKNKNKKVEWAWMKKRPAKPIKIKEHVLDIEDYLKCKNYRN